MSSILLNKEPIRHSSSRFINQHGQIENVTVQHSILEQVELSPSVGTVAYGNKVHFRIPREGFLEEMFLRLDHVTSGSEVMANSSFYLNNIKKLEMKVGSNSVFLIDAYDEYINYVLAKMPANKRAMFYGLAGHRRVGSMQVRLLALRAQGGCGLRHMPTSV